MFGNGKENEISRAAQSGRNSNNLFGVGTVIEGEIKTEGEARIDGKIIGTVTSKSKIVIGKTGVVEGDIICSDAHVEGKVVGKLEVSDLLYLSKTADIEGDIIIGKLVVEEGAKFNGTSRMGSATKRGSHGEAKPKKEFQSVKKEAV